MNAEPLNPVIGQPIDRVDGRAKVMGAARYAADFPVENVAHVFLLLSTVASGSIHKMDTSGALRAPGVLAVITSANVPRLHEPNKNPDARPGEQKLPLQSEDISYDGQIIGMIVAETFEQARDAAELVQPVYTSAKHEVTIEEATDISDAKTQSPTQKMQMHRGDSQAAMQTGGLVVVDQTYETPVQHHNPMEPHATIAEWKGERLTIYTSTQSVVGCHELVADVLGLKEDQVQVISPFVGGGFGSKGFIWPHHYLAAIAARAVSRPAKLVHTRQQMFTCNGHRSRTIQKITLAATRDGKLSVLRHASTAHTSRVGEFVESCGLASSMLYAAPNADITHRVARINVPTPTPTRAPGEAPGTYAIEAAMDELAYAVNLDPLQLRLVNYAEQNPQEYLPWSSKHLRECYTKGAEAFGWNKRQPTPRSMRDGRYMIGYGMATATYPANRGGATARVQMDAQGHVIVSTATQDIGTGTYTILTQIAAEALGVPVGQVEVRIGNSALPRAPGSGGSRTAASVGPAVRDAADHVRRILIDLAVRDPQSPLHQADGEKLVSDGGRLFMTGGSAHDSYMEIMRRNGLPSVVAQDAALTMAQETGKSESQGDKPGGSQTSSPGTRVLHPDTGADATKHSFHSFGAQFAEVQVDPDTLEIRVRRIVTALDVGRVLNAKTARSQALGGVVFGIGAALMESTEFDHPRGRIVTRNLADYHVPVNADVPDINVILLDHPDPYINSIGCRGIGEIGITGITAAIANAVYHATGKRVRNLPITPDKLI